MIPETLYILDSQRPQAERLIKNGCAENLLLYNLYDIARIEFRLTYERRIIDMQDIDQIQLMLKDLYAAYDKWQAEQK